MIRKHSRTVVIGFVAGISLFFIVYLIIPAVWNLNVSGRDFSTHQGTHGTIVKMEPTFNGHFYRYKVIWKHPMQEIILDAEAEISYKSPERTVPGYVLISDVKEISEE